MLHRPEPGRRRRRAPRCEGDPVELAELRRIVAMRGTAGYSEAVKAFALKNQGLAWSYAERWRCDDVPQEDLRQQAMVGLLETIELWDPRRRTRFSSYAMHRMRYAVQRYIRKKAPLVHLPQNVISDRALVERHLRAGAAPAELARLTGLSGDRVDRALAARRRLAFEPHQEQDGSIDPPDLDLRRLLAGAAAGEAQAQADLAEMLGVPLQDVAERVDEIAEGLRQL